MPRRTQETLLVAFLSELVYARIRRALVSISFGRARDRILERSYGRRAYGIVAKAIKAVTFHNLKINCSKRGPPKPRSCLTSAKQIQ